MDSKVRKTSGPSPRPGGFTLVELLVVVAIIGIMLAVVVPASGPMIRNQRLTSGKNLVKSALGQARAYAIKEQKYAGLRFQFDRNGWHTGRQYLVLVEQATTGDTTYRPIPNAQPIAMPEGIAAIDQRVLNSMPPYQYLIKGVPAYGPETTIPQGLMNETTFNVLFSPQGQMVVKEIAVWPRTTNDPFLDFVSSPTSLLIADGGYGPTGSPIPSAPWLPGGTSGSVPPLREATVTGVLIASTEELASCSDVADTGKARVQYLKGLATKGQHLIFNIYTGKALEDWQ